MLQLPCKLYNQLIYFLLKPANVSSKHSSIDFSRAKSKVIYLTSTIKLLTLKRLLLHKCKLFLMCVLFHHTTSITKTRRENKVLANIIFIMKVFISSPYLQLANPNAKMCLYLYAISKIRWRIYKYLHYNKKQPWCSRYMSK